MTSMPAASCSFSQRRVASRLARSSSPPPARQAGHNLLVSASQLGLGRLPAMVVLSKATLLLSWFLDIVQTVISQYNSHYKIGRSHSARHGIRFLSFVLSRHADSGSGA